MCKAKVIPVYNSTSDLLPVVLEETGGLGVDIVIDSGGKHIFLIHTVNTDERVSDCKVRSVGVPSGLSEWYRRSAHIL